jgi:hypothetical protein
MITFFDKHDKNRLVIFREKRIKLLKVTAYINSNDKASPKGANSNVIMRKKISIFYLLNQQYL